MKPVSHLGVSLLTGIVAYISTKELLPGISCFMIGWLIDIDHIWDYYVNVGKKFSVSKFLNAMDSGKIKKSYLYFHSYEILIVLVILCLYTQLNQILFFTTLGFAIHLFLDQIFNPVKPFTYFITYRIINKYNVELIFKINTSDLSGV